MAKIQKKISTDNVKYRTIAGDKHEVVKMHHGVKPVSIEQQRFLNEEMGTREGGPKNSSEESRRFLREVMGIGS